MEDGYVEMAFERNYQDGKRKVLHELKWELKGELSAFRSDPDTEYRNGVISGIEIGIYEIDELLKELNK